MKEIKPSEPYPVEADHGDLIKVLPIFAGGKPQTRKFCSGCDYWVKQRRWGQHAEHFDRDPSDEDTKVLGKLGGPDRCRHGHGTL